MPQAWSEKEVEIIVQDYFQMLKMELTGERYNKSAHRRLIIDQLDGRSHGSIEMKHQNISAVLNDMGIPGIIGYKPRSNYQRNILPDAISDYLKNDPEFFSLVKADADRGVQVPSVKNILTALEKPPEVDRGRESKDSVAESIPSYCPAKINYLEREASNLALGDAGETFVLNFEKARLISQGKDSLAGRIEHVAKTIGPSAGYDIRSFDATGRDRFIEAKTTKYGKSTPFYLSRNELAFSQKNSGQYYLYRVFEFRHHPRLFQLKGYLQECCQLTPSQFTARVG